MIFTLFISAALLCVCGLTIIALFDTGHHP
jgi:hypothetical protein